MTSVFFNPSGRMTVWSVLARSLFS